MIVIPSIVLIHLFTKCILDCDKKIKFFIELFGMLLLFALSSFEINVVAAIFNLVIGILFIFIGNKNEDYLSLFYDGIILLILDVIVQFSEYWLKIPFYVYIFLLGILLVGYATYRELNKNKAKVVNKVEHYILSFLNKQFFYLQLY